jgi:hypothetical protein
MKRRNSFRIECHSNSAFCILNSAFCILHSDFCILHSAFCILTSAFIFLAFTDHRSNMKYPLAIFTAAAAAAWALVQSVIGSTQAQIDPDAATPLPRLTPNLVEKLANAGATNAELADRFLVEESFIAREFADVLRATRAHRRIMLRGLQTDACRKLNASMLTWLGKNELGQSTSPEPPDEAMPEVYEP